MNFFFADLDRVIISNGATFFITVLVLSVKFTLQAG